MDIIKRMMHGLFTDADGDHDIVRWGCAAGIIAAIFLAGWDVVKNHNHFDIQAWGIGFCALLAGVGAALKLKKDEAKE